MGEPPVAQPLPQDVAQNAPQTTGSQDLEPPRATPASLLADEDLMVRVTRRLRELDNEEDEDSAYGATAAPLATRMGKRSGQVCTVDDIVIQEVDWPHLYVYRGTAHRPVKYGDMTVTEFVYGYLQMIYNLRNYFDQDVMLGILRNIKEDALTYPWDNVRNFYRVLSSMVEMDRVQWTDTEQISTLRYHYAHRPANMYRAQQATPSGRQTGYPIKTCAAYQRGECTEAGDHAGFAHACVFCARMKQTAYPHTDKDCRGKKFMQSQNAYPPPPPLLPDLSEHSASPRQQPLPDSPPLPRGGPSGVHCTFAQATDDGNDPDTNSDGMDFNELCEFLNESDYASSGVLTDSDGDWNGEQVSDSLREQHLCPVPPQNYTGYDGYAMPPWISS